MNLGEILLLLSVVLAGFAAITSLQRLLRVKISPSVPRYISVMAGLVALGTMLFLFNIFLTTDLDYEIVWKYSSEDMPTVYKLSGSWAGKAGSMILWTTMLLSFWMVEELRWWRRDRLGLLPEGDSPPEGPEAKERKGRKGRSRQPKRSLGAKMEARMAERRAAPAEGWLTLDVIRTVVMLVALVLLLATLALDPFAARTYTFPAGGNGLDPALRTPLMAIHPPIVFMAYAMTAIVFGAAMALIIKKDPLWTDVARPWTRLAWFTLTLGIGLGAMWAYETLGWGGYWAWDPVETSSLLPWISLTALLHTLHSHDRRQDDTYVAPLLAGMSLFLVFFATFVTRSGVWASVHSYAGASAGSTIDQLAGALSDSGSLRWLYYGMWAVLIATMASVLWKYWRAEEDPPMLPDRDEDESPFEWLARWRVSMFATVFLLSISMILALLMLLSAAGGSVPGGEYDSRLAIFVLPLMVVLVICMAAQAGPHRRQAVVLAGIGVLAGVVAWAINPGGIDPAIVNLALGIGIVGVVAVLARFGPVLKAKRNRFGSLVRLSGTVLIHLGLVLVFMAYCMTNIPTLPQTEGTTPIEDLPLEHDVYEVYIEDRGWTFDTGVRDRNERWDEFDGEVRVVKEGTDRASGPVKVITSWKYRQYGTLTYEEGTTTKAMNGEVLSVDPADNSRFIARFQSFREPEEVVTVDPWNPNDLKVWPALLEDSDILKGQYLRIRNETRIWEGFLRSVDGLRGKVTLVLRGEETVIPGPEVSSVYRRAYVGLVTTDVFIYRTPVRDVYVSVLNVKPLEDGTFVATVMVMEVPAMAFLWTGMFMMSMGILLRPLENWRFGKEGDPSGGGTGEEGEHGDDDGDLDHEGEDVKTDEDEEVE